MQIPDYIASYRASLTSYIAAHGREKAMELIVGGQYEEIGILEASALLTLGLKPESFLVDVGCGSGRLAYALAGLHSGRYVGTDILGEALAYAKEKVGRSDWEFIETMEIAIPVESASADMVCFFSVFSHLLDEDTYRFLIEAKRALKKGGLIIFSYLDFDVPSHWTVFESTLANKDPKRVLNKFMSKSGIKKFTEMLGLEVLAIYDGYIPWINLIKDFKYTDGRIASGVVEFGQSVCVLRL